jgi:CHAD domain-containing protein
VAPAAGVALGRDQHVLAQGRQKLTAQRAAIRRRFAVGRWTHRPPRSIGKTGHRTIVAPLAGAIAAGVAVRVGLALAKAGSERRCARQRRCERRLGLLDGELPLAGLRRMMLAQADIAIEALASADSIEQGEQAVHETRKAIKRMRTLLRLLREELGEPVYARENAALGELGHSLAGTRDAEVMLDTFQALIARGSRQLRGRHGVARLRAELQAERERTRTELLEDAVGRQRAIRQLKTFRDRAGKWGTDASERAVEQGARRLYQRGRRGYRQAKRGKRPHTRRMHEWRKRVKDLRYVAEALGPTEQSPVNRKASAAKAAKWLRRVAKRADLLSELLGEEHDLAVLSEWIEGRYSERGRGAVGRRTAKELSRLIVKRRRKLRRRALREGKRLYDHSGKGFTRRIRAAQIRPRSRLS